MAAVDSTHNSVPSGDATCVFRMQMNDMTAPDLMKSQVISKPVLTIIKGPQTGNTFELEGALTTVGRDPANSIFLNDMTVSRSHAKIKHDASGVSIEAVSYTHLPIADLAACAHEHGAYFHTDAIQGFLHVPFDIDSLGIDALSLAGHKIGGPVGVLSLIHI